MSTHAVGIDYDTPCDCDVTGEFWYEFSALFAQASSGTALFLGNGERTNGAYSDQSYFATVEIPNMTNRVERVAALIIHEKRTGMRQGHWRLRAGLLKPRRCGYNPISRYQKIGHKDITLLQLHGPIVQRGGSICTAS